MIHIQTHLLKAARTAAQLSQRDMAEEMGISTETYRKKEAGAVYFTDEQKLQIVVLLGLTLVQFDDIFYDGKLLKAKSILRNVKVN